MNFMKKFFRDWYRNCCCLSANAIYEEPEVTIESSSVIEEVIKPSETPKIEPEDVIITEGNVEDWDQILDDWEIEEAKWEDAYYE